MNKRAKRVLALVLALAMMLQQTSIGSAAAETETEPVSEVVAVQETGTEAETQIGTENGSEKLTEAATPAEQDAQSETDASEQSETEDPAETETAAETSEPVTEPAAETEKTTEAAAESEPDTTVETEPASAAETDAETETESESETAAEAGPTLLNASYNGVGVSVSAAPGVLEAGTTLEMLPVAKSRPYQTLMAALEEGKEINKDKFLSYDIRLVKDGQEVQPNGEVTVTFVNVPFAAEENEEMIVAHLQENAAANTGINTVAFYGATTASVAEMQKGLSLTTTHFSVYAVSVLKLKYEEDQKKNPPDDKYEAYKDIPSITEKYVPRVKNTLTYVDENGEEVRLDSAAFDFHIFSDEAHIGQHTNGNIATNHIYGGSQGFGTNQAASDGVVEYNYFGKTAEDLGQLNAMLGNPESKTVLGKGFTSGLTYTDGSEKGVYVGTNGTKQGEEYAKHIYKQDANDTEDYIDITSELNKLKRFSQQIANKSSGDDVVSAKDGKITVDPNAEAQLVYLNIDATTLAQINNATTWDITIPAGKTLIINVNMSGVNSNQLAQLETKVNGLSNGEPIVRENCSLLWNFYQKNGENYETYTGTAYVGNGNGFLGTILAPAAEIHYGAVNGSIIANKTVQNGNESHNWTFLGCTATITLDKILEDEEVSADNPKTFYFALFDVSDGTPKRVPNRYVASLTFTGPGTKTVEFGGLKPGKYKIYETDANGTIVNPSGYEVTNNAVDVVIEKEDDGTVKDGGSITNTSTKQKTGKLKIQKSVTVNGKATTGTEADGTYYFDIYDVKGNVVREVSVTVTNGVSQTREFSGFVPGTYTVKENVNSNPEGMTLTSPSNNSIQVEVKADETATVPTASFTNNKVLKGSLKIKKNVTINGSDPAGRTDADGTYTFEIKDEDDNTVNTATVTVTGGVSGTVTVSNLDPGTYTVHEKDAGNGTTLVGGNDLTVTVSADSTAEVQTAEFTNNKEVKGSLTITKAVTLNGQSAEGKTDVDGTYVFNVKKAGDQSVVRTVEITIKNGQSGEVTVTGLEEGDYIVSEDTSKNPAGVTLTGGNDIPVTVEAGSTATVPVAAFTNNKNVGSLKITKNVTVNNKPITESGFTRMDGDYTFELRKDGQLVRTVTVTIANAQSNTVQVDGLLPGEYTVKELVPSGMIVTPAGGEVPVTVAAGNTAYIPTAEFINNLNFEAQAEITGTKTLTGKDLKAGEFKFEIKRDDWTDKSVVATNDGQGSFKTQVVFTEDEVEKVVTGGQPVTYHYTVHEKTGSVVPAGGTMKYSDVVFNVEVTLTYDVTTGKVTPTVNYPDGPIVFSNTYDAETKITLDGTKTLDGKKQEAGTFTFTVRDEANTVVSTGKNNQDGTITFTPIPYKLNDIKDGKTYGPKTYTYTVKEDIPEDAKLIDGKYVKDGITYDSTVKTVKVTVTYDPKTGIMTADKDDSSDEISFTNTYGAAGEITFEGTKFIEGIEETAKVFTFELYETNNTFAVAENAVPEDKASTSGKIEKSQEYAFKPIKYEKAGTYYYVVKEKALDAAEGFTIDTNEYHITVVVTDDGKGKLEAKAEGANVTALNFTNKYEAKGAQITFKGTKFLKDIDSTDKEFTFELYETDENYAIAEGAAPLQSKSTSGTITGSQSYTFDEIKYDKVGTHYYLVREKALDAADGFLIDQKQYKIKVDVTDNGQGQLIVTPNHAFDKLDFTNEYSTEDAKVNFEGTKFVEGTESTDKVFTFGLFETDESFAVADGAAPLQSVSTSGTIKGSQDYAFAELTYTEEGTHYYVVKEAVPDEKDGFTYDTTVYQITVKVEDNGKGSLVATTSGASVGALNFTNEYKAEEAELTFSGTKFIKGIGSTDLEFTFELYETDESYAVAEDAAPLQSVSTSGTIQGSQDYSFGKLTYTEAGTHYYVVKEKAQDAVNGFTFDDTVYTVKVDVTDDGKGTLTAEADQAVDAFDFTNSYETTDADITFGGTKFVEGTESTDQVFTFALYETDETFAAAEGAAPLQSVSTSGTITGSQDYTFAELTYTEEGTHYYVVKETVVEEAPGFTYDTTVYEITVTVTDDGNGNLVAKADVDEKALDFTNTYAAEGTLSLEAVKTMADPADTLGTFQFEVKDESENTVATASNGADGRILFQNIVTYTAADAGKTFTYTVSEVQPEKPDGYVYDTKVYTVNVTVADNGDGTLKVDAVIDGADTMSFVNDQTHVSIRKVDEEGSALAGARLVIKSEDGKAVESWTTDGNAHDITGLPAGSYTLSEVEAPEGYEISEDVKFEVTGQSAGTIEVVMTDTRKPEEFRGSISVTKMQVDQDGMAIGGQEATFYVALFEDAAKTKRVSPVKAVHFGSMSLTSTAALFENLGAGTYYVSETDEVGNPIESGLYGEVLFWADYPNGDTVTLETDTFSGQLNFNNQFYELPPGYMYMGELQITKAVQKRIKKGSQETTEEYPMTGVFYAGIFNDPEYTDLYGMVPIEVNGTSSSTVVIELPVSEDPGVLKRTYYVTEVDENGIPLVNGNELGFVFDVNGSGTGTTVEVSSDSTVEYATITNTYLEEIESEIITETETVKETTPETTATKAAKTGDETNYWIYLFLLLMSAGTAVVVTEEKRRAKKNRK